MAKDVVPSTQLMLHHPAHIMLVCFNELRKHIIPVAGKPMSDAILVALAGDGIGVATSSGVMRAPRSLKEVSEMPAATTALEALDAREQHERNDRTAQSKSAKTFNRMRSLEDAGPAAATSELREFHETIGLRMLFWLRHVISHVFETTADLVKAGWNADVVDRAVTAAMKAWQDKGGAVNDSGLPVPPPDEEPLSP